MVVSLVHDSPLLLVDFLVLDHSLLLLLQLLLWLELVLQVPRHKDVLLVELPLVLLESPDVNQSSAALLQHSHQLVDGLVPELEYEYLSESLEKWWITAIEMK